MVVTGVYRQLLSDNTNGKSVLSVTAMIGRQVVAGGKTGSAGQSWPIAINSDKVMFCSSLL